MWAGIILNNCEWHEFHIASGTNFTQQHNNNTTKINQSVHRACCTKLVAALDSVPAALAPCSCTNSLHTPSSLARLLHPFASTMPTITDFTQVEFVEVLAMHLERPSVIVSDTHAPG